MLTCLIIAFFITYAVVALRGGAKFLSDDSKYKTKEQLWEEQKTDIDPVTGDYTQKGTSLRFDKYGVMKGSE